MCEVIYATTERLEENLSLHWYEEPLTKDDLDYIYEGICFNCEEKAGLKDNIDFVRLISGGLMWWHKQCPILRKNK